MFEKYNSTWMTDHTFNLAHPKSHQSNRLVDVKKLSIVDCRTRTFSACWADDSLISSGVPDVDVLIVSSPFLILWQQTGTISAMHVVVSPLSGTSSTFWLLPSLSSEHSWESIVTLVPIGGSFWFSWALAVTSGESTLADFLLDWRCFS